MNKQPRSFLFSPGDSRRKIEKGALSAADALIIDLEDAVAPAAKEKAREICRAALTEIEFGTKLRLVRVNGPETDVLSLDLAAVAGVPFDGLVLPKASTAADVLQLVNLAQEQGITAPLIYVLLESARSIVEAAAIAALPQVTGLMFGGEDYLASIEGRKSDSGLEFHYARSTVVTAARAFGLEAIDTIFIEIDQAEGLSREANLARGLGFSGKLCVHPQQVERVNAAFRPTAEEQRRAQAIVSAYEEQIKHGIGVFSYEGRMIDEAVVRQLQQLL